MERNVSTLDGKKDGVVFVVDVNHVFLQIFGELVSGLVGLDFGGFDNNLLFEVA